MRQVMNGTRPIAMGIGETGPSSRPRAPFEPKHAAPKPPPQAAPESQRIAMVAA